MGRMTKEQRAMMDLTVDQAICLTLAARSSGVPFATLARAAEAARRLAPSKWNLWIGGDDGKFYDLQCWSHGCVPTEGDYVALNTGTMTVPGTISLAGLALIGPGHIKVEANPANKVHPRIETLTSTRAAADAGCTIGTQGRAL